MEKIIITGGLGHIGSYLIRRILSENKKLNLIIVDNLSSQRYPSLFNLPKNKNVVSFYDFNVTKKNIAKIAKKAKLLIHLSASTDAEKSLGKEKEYLLNNLNSTKEVIEYCKEYQVPLIFPSSTSVYGKMIKNDTLYENDFKKLYPQSPYAKIKLLEEKMISAKKNKLNYVILRLGTIIGNSFGMRFHTAVNKFCYQASTNKEITVWKSAFKQVRPYLTIEDFYDFIKIFLNNPKKITNEIYNCVSDNLSVKQIIDIINLKKKIRVKFVTSKIMNQLSYNVSCVKAKNIGFNPKKKIKQEIFKTLKLFEFSNIKY